MQPFIMYFDTTRTNMKFFVKLLCLPLIAVLTGCSMARDIPYFKGLQSSEDAVGVVQHEARICPDDMLSIIVSGIDPLAVAPFNLPVVAYQSPGSENIYSTPSFQPYLVDKEGYIDFPVIGKMKLGGLLKSEAIAYIKKQLEPYLKDPIITIQFMSYKVTVLGEVARPNTYTINTERVSILEALGRAGDLTIYGRRDNVLLIREKEGGVKEYVRINLNDTDILTSEYYYLQQNDVIYVEANKTKVTSASSTNVSLYLSALSTLASMATVIVSIVVNAK